MTPRTLLASPLLLLLPACASTPEASQAPPPPDAVETGVVQDVTPASIVAPVGDAVRADPADVLPPDVDTWKLARYAIPIPTYDRPAAELSWDDVAQELIDMRDPELARYRRAAPESQRDPAVHAHIQRIDEAHVSRLKEIVEAHGWPTFERVGAHAASAAVLTAQYAGHDPDFLEQAIELMTPLARTGEVSPPYVALLTDRLRVYRGQEQLFGTQVEVTLDASGLPPGGPPPPPAGGPPRGGARGGGGGGRPGRRGGP
ncbi:MAG: DUF6624 domain-containing protein, partial [Phycisphaerales bacterium JB059]